MIEGNTQVIQEMNNMMNTNNLRIINSYGSVHQ